MQTFEITMRAKDPLNQVYQLVPRIRGMSRHKAIDLANSLYPGYEIYFVIVLSKDFKDGENVAKEDM